MSIKIRPTETKCNITLNKIDWLGVLTYLSQYQEQASTEKIDEVVKDCIKEIRSFVLNKGGSEPFCLELSKEDALEFYLFLKDFQSRLEGDQKEGVTKCIGTIRNFLVEGTNEQQS